MRRAFLILCALGLGACQPRIDASSAQAYAGSIQAMTEHMTPEQRQEFQSSLIAIAFNTSDPAGQMFAQSDPASPIFLAAASRIAGRTAPEIVHLGYETRIGILDREIAEAMASIQRQTAERDRHRAIFDNVHIDGARYHVGDTIGIPMPGIAFTITNNSAIPIKAIYLHGVLTSPGRALPWVAGDLNYQFSGGLEPNETQHLDLQPNMFGEWRADDRYSNRSDLQLTLRLVNLEGADGQQLIQGNVEDIAAKQAEVGAKQRLRSELQSRLTAG